MTWLAVFGWFYWLEPSAERTWDGFVLPGLAVSLDGAVFGLAAAFVVNRYVGRRLPPLTDPNGPNRVTRLRFVLGMSGLVGLALFTLVQRALDAPVDVYGTGAFAYLAVWGATSLRIDGQFRGMAPRPDAESFPPL